MMISAAAWIAIRPVRHHHGFLAPAFCALGMYFANSMNAISLAAERYHADAHQGKAESDARITAFHAAMIPQLNGLLAVGLVALPGMMAGKILSGVSPLVAVRYQIMIMTMLLGARGMGAALRLWLLSMQAFRIKL